MTRDEIKAVLTERGVEFAPQTRTATLEKLLEESAPADVFEGKTEEAVIEELEIKEAIELEDLVEQGGVHVEGGVRKPSGIIVPSASLVRRDAVGYTYTIEHSEGESRVFKVTPRGTKTFVRAYTAELHGDKARELAEFYVSSRS